MRRSKEKFEQYEVDLALYQQRNGLSVAASLCLEAERQTKLDTWREYFLFEHRKLGRLRREVESVKCLPSDKQPIFGKSSRATYNVDEKARLSGWIEEQLVELTAQSIDGRRTAAALSAASAVTSDNFISASGVTKFPTRDLRTRNDARRRKKSYSEGSISAVRASKVGKDHPKHTTPLSTRSHTYHKRLSDAFVLNCGERKDCDVLVHSKTEILAGEANTFQNPIRSNGASEIRIQETMPNRRTSKSRSGRFKSGAASNRNVPAAEGSGIRRDSLPKKTSYSRHTSRRSERIRQKQLEQAPAV